MANNTTLSNAAAKAALDAVTDLLDTATEPGFINIYNGSQPTNPDIATTTQTLLAQLTLSTTAFGAAADLGPNAQATAASVTSDSSANATGTAAWFRATDGALVAHIDGTVGTSGADANFNTVSFVSGATISVTAWTITMSETP